MDQEKNLPDETQNTVGNTQEPTASSNVTIDAPKKKKGLGSRIVHSKDSTKLIGALAFCAVFATCTLLAVTVFDKPGHLGDKGADIRMEQRANSDRGNMPDMGSNDRFNGSGDYFKHGNKPNGNATAPDGAQPNDESSTNDRDAQNGENKSEKPNSTDDSSKKESSSSSTTSYFA